MLVYQCHKGKRTSCRDLLASKVSVVDGIKDVSERIQFGSLILKNSGDIAASVFWSATSSSMANSSIVRVHSFASLGIIREKICC